MLSYMAMQRSAVGTDSGAVAILRNAKRLPGRGSACMVIHFRHKLKGSPLVVGSVQSSSQGVTHWIENIDSTKFQACFSGRLTGKATFTWFAFDESRGAWPSKSQQDAGRAQAPKWHQLKRASTTHKLFVTCKTIRFKESYNSVPTVLVTANHQDANNLDWTGASHYAVDTFIQSASRARFQVCSTMVIAAKAQPNNSGLKWDWFVLSAKTQPLKKKEPSLSLAQTIRSS